MCEYLNELKRFGEYRFQSDVTISQLQHAPDPLHLLTKAFEKHTKRAVIYLVYREEGAVHHAIRLRLGKQRRARLRLGGFLDTILNPVGGELEIYYFESTSAVETSFHKLYGLLLERCDTHRIERDYEEYFIGGLTGVFKRFMLDSYAVLSHNPMAVAGILFFALVTFQYLALMDAGYPFELIDNNAVLFLNKYLLYGVALLIAVPLIVTLVRAYLSTTYQPKRLSNEKFKLTFIAVFYLMLIATYASRSALEEPIRNLFIRSYNAMHIFPRVGVNSRGEHKLVMGTKARATYYYDLDPNSSTLRQILCTEDPEDTIIHDDPITRVILRGAQYNFSGTKKIRRSSYSEHFDLLDINHSNQILQKTYCSKDL